VWDDRILGDSMDGLSPVVGGGLVRNNKWSLSRQLFC
jgi:hypothetical protein